jgi:cytochrome c biogenesis protein CcdA/thioredoxin-related protein
MDMNKIVRFFLLAVLSFTMASAVAQDASPFTWKVTSKKLSDGQYELIFSTQGNPAWELYAPSQVLSEVPTTELRLGDSAVQAVGNLVDSGQSRTIQSVIFEQAVKVYDQPTAWKQVVRISGQVPSFITGTLLYTYGKGEEFYAGTPHDFTVNLEGGVVSTSRIIIPSIDVKNPVSPCGDDDTDDKSLWTIFLLGFTGGLIALVTPCVFPLIPMTVSFFTKRSANRKKGIFNAVLYGFSIFMIYVLLSLPFHLIDSANPEILNNISTNMWVNLVFFVVFILFALSFFGLYEITLPSGLANKIDSKGGLNDIWGIFFMALTLAIVSFSCTGPILGSLLAGVSNNDGGALQLSFGMAGFGVGLGLPFALFALFPGWLQSLPKSGGWLTSVKVVLGFLELALAVKFLSNADLVEQWGLLKREIFIGIWVVIGLCIVLYLTGAFRFGRSKPAGASRIGVSKPKITKLRWFFILLFSLITLYLIPGVTNTKWANLRFISGFPPPMCYSVYKKPVNCERNIQPLHDYEAALQEARRQNKPILIDFTGWACVNCRRMEENVWTNPDVAELMKNRFIVVSLYVDERKKLPAKDRVEFESKNGEKKQVVTVGDKWTNFQIENFYKTSQPQYAIISPDEKALTRTKGYTPDPDEFVEWLECGLAAFKR